MKSSKDENVISRVIEIIRNIIIEAEKKGTSEVRPHSALLKGELLERIVIKNKASPNISQITVSIYSNSTFWDFKRKIAERLSLGPKYLKLVGPSGKAYKDTEHGRTLAELGLQTGIQLTAEKIQIVEEIPNAPLTDTTGKLTERTTKIFNDWFDLYSDENSKMTKETCCRFIKGCTGELPSTSDERVLNMFKTYDKNGDGFIEREEFLQFYQLACNQKPDTVRDNLRHHNIRADLKKLSEVREVESFKAQDMPRLKISKNEVYFDQLMSLLDKSSALVSGEAWSLIQMLATSPEIYTRVLKLQSAKNDDKIDWTRFFDNNSVYKLLYTLQIVEAVMEEGEGQGMEKIEVIDYSQNTGQKKPPPPAPVLPGANVPLPPSASAPVNPSGLILVESLKPDEVPSPLQVSTSHIVNGEIAADDSIIGSKSEENRLKAEWTRMFLEGNGFEYILNVFMTKPLSTTEGLFDLKHMAFLLKLLRIFLMAAFSTSAEASIYDATRLIRRTSSSVSPNDSTHGMASILDTTLSESEFTRFKQL